MALVYSFRRRSFLHLVRSFCTAERTAPPPPETVLTARSKLKSTTDTDEILSVLQSISDDPAAASHPLTRHVRDFALVRLSKRRRFKDIEKLLDLLKSHLPVVPEKEYYLSGLIISAGKAGMPDLALRYFDSLPEIGIERNAYYLNAYLTALKACKKFKLVVESFRDLLSQNPQIVPDRFSYGIYIKSLCETGSPDSAYEVLDEMREKGVEITVVIYTIVMDGFLQKRNSEMGMKIWEIIKKECASSIDVACFNTRMLHIHKTGKPEEILALFDEMAELGIAPNTTSFNFLINCYFKNEKPEEAIKVYEEMESKGCKPDMATYQPLLHYLSKAGDYDNGLKIYWDSVKSNRVPDFGTMRPLMEGLVKNGKTEEARKVVSEMKRRFPAGLLKSWKELEEKLHLAESVEDVNAVQVANA